MHRGASRKAQGPALPQSHPLSLQVEPDGRIVGRAGQARGLRLAPRPPLVPHELCQPNRAMRSAFPRDPRRTGTRRCPYMELIQEDRHKALSLHGTYPARVGIPLQRPQQDRHKALSLQQCPIGEEGLSWRLEQDKHKAQYISNKRPSRFVILSETKDLARRTEILRFTQSLPLSEAKG